MKIRVAILCCLAFVVVVFAGVVAFAEPPVNYKIFVAFRPGGARVPNPVVPGNVTATVATKKLPHNVFVLKSEIKNGRILRENSTETALFNADAETFVLFDVSDGDIASLPSDEANLKKSDIDLVLVADSQSGKACWFGIFDQTSNQWAYSTVPPDPPSGTSYLIKADDGSVRVQTQWPLHMIMRSTIVNLACQ